MQQDDERHEAKRGHGERQATAHHANPLFRNKAEMRSGFGHDSKFRYGNSRAAR
jgi:hypothetical protein